MTNDHFISIFIISCILLGIQSSVSAQSSDWVYSPYAQYLTNDTTIPPPVGEPADAALSCFRHDTIYVLVMPTGQLYIWLRPDPLMDKNIGLSPYVYCHANPLRYIDPDGRDDFFNEYGEYLEHIDNGTDYVMIRNTNGDVQNLIDFSYSKDNESNRAMLSKVASYYAQKVGIYQQIEVNDYDVEDGFAVTNLDYCQVYIAVINGMISSCANTSNNIMNSFVHEKEHMETEVRGYVGEVSAIQRQITHSTWANTTTEFKHGIFIYLINNAVQAIRNGYYNDVKSLVTPNLSILNQIGKIRFDDNRFIYSKDIYSIMPVIECTPHK